MSRLLQILSQVKRCLLGFTTVSLLSAHPPGTRGRTTPPRLPSHSAVLFFLLEAGQSHQEEDH